MKSSHRYSRFSRNHKPDLAAMANQITKEYMSAQPQPQPIQSTFANVAGVAFNLAGLLAIDHSGYENGKPGRAITLYLAGPVALDFVDERADQFWVWYLQLTGQAKIQAP